MLFLSQHRQIDKWNMIIVKDAKGEEIILGDEQARRRRSRKNQGHRIETCGKRRGESFQCYIASYLSWWPLPHDVSFYR